MLSFFWECECGHKNYSEEKDIGSIMNDDIVKCHCENCDKTKDVIIEIKVQK